MAEEFFISSLENIPGSDIEEHYGIVTGTSVKSFGKLASFMANFKTFMGGEAKDLSSVLDKTREEAIESMSKNAKKHGANCILNVRFQTVFVRPGVAEVNAYGTAVKIMKY